jgi:sec-independent protein translocase protein TatB
MFNLGAGEIAVIMIVALLLLGPDKLPELARGIGKFVREFRRQTDDVRGMVEREFYKMDTEVFAEEQAAQAKRIEPPATPQPAIPAATTGPEGGDGTELTPPEYPSIFPPPEGVVAARPASAAPLGMEAPAEAPAESEPAGTAASEATASARPERDPASHG